MDEREYRRRIRRNRIAQEEKKRIRQQLRQTMVVCALACVAYGRPNRRMRKRMRRPRPVPAPS